jgi:thiol reductant ABC exporter CydC subunit
VSGERRAIRRALAAGVGVALSSVGLAGTSAWLIVRAAERPAVLSLTVPMGLVQLFALAKAGGRYVERTTTHAAALGVVGRLRAGVARLLEPLVPAGLGPRSAEVVDLAVRDVDRVQDLVSVVMGPLVTSVAAGLVTVAVSGLIVPATAISLLVALGLNAVLWPSLAARAGRRSEGELDDVRADLVALVDDLAQHGDEVVMAGAWRAWDERREQLEDRYDVALRRQQRTAAVVSAVTVATAGATAIVTILLVRGALVNGDLARSLLAVPVLAALASLELVGTVAPALVGWRGDWAALGRLEALGGLAAPVREPAASGSWDTAASGTVVARDVTCAYDATTTLRGTFDLGPGDVAVIEGPSGSGKTTAARLLAKFLDPVAGHVAIDGVDYRELRGDQVRERVGLVADEPYVFATSLAGNLRVARPDATDEELRDACRAAQLGDWLATRPEGLDTPLGGATTGLSGGEQRRLGVAREFLRDRCVVVLDEPTEGLDDATARALLATLRARYRDRALLVVSHHESDREGATRRFVTRDGWVREVPVATPGSS